MRDPASGPTGGRHRARTAAQRRYSSGVTSPEEILADEKRQDHDRARQSEVPLSDRPLAKRWPECAMPIAGVVPEFMTWTADDSQAGMALCGLQERYQRFCNARNELLQEYCLNTARAYWGDLDDFWRWAERRGMDVLALRQGDIRQYVALLRRRQYSENTIRRRIVALNKLSKL